MESYNLMMRFERAPLFTMAQATADGDLVPPSSMPPIASVLSVSGQATAAATPQNGLMAVDGAVTLSVVYVCANGRVHGFDSLAVFKHDVELIGAKPAMHCLVSASVGEITHRLSGGTLNVHALVLLSLTARENTELDAIESVRDAQTRSMAVDICTIDSAGDELTLREDARLPRVADKLLGISGFARTTDVTIESGKAIVDGMLKVDALFTTPDGTLVQSPLTVPFTHRILIPGTTENVAAFARILSLNAVLVDEDIISIDALLELTLLLHEKRHCELLEDAYSTTEIIKCEKAILPVVDSSAVSCRTTLRLSTTVPEGMPPAERTLVALTRPELHTSSAMHGKISLSGHIYASLVYVCHEGNLHGFSVKVPFEAECEAPSMIDTSTLSLDANCELIHAGANHMEIPLQLMLDVSAAGWKIENANVITSLSTAERPEPQYGPMIYFPTPDEGLWEVGKRFGLTIDELKRLNPSSDAPRAVLINSKRGA